MWGRAPPAMQPLIAGLFHASPEALLDHTLVMVGFLLKG